MENYQIRKKIHPKQRVAVLLKEDYENGNLTYGTVDEILTKTEKKIQITALLAG